MRVGLTVDEFWNLTPRELSATFEVFAWRQEQLERRLLSLAWYTAALVRTKRLPSLKQLLNPKPAKLTPAELAERQREFEELSQRMGGGKRG